ncbi:unnamed protein product [Coregonus sp. 'balchen']|nr:unnamed protein product [Coregonus sp. 'balchen']
MQHDCSAWSTVLPNIFLTTRFHCGPFYMTGLSNINMATSQIYIWTFTIFIFPTITWGLLSDFKICGDSECESLLSRVRATRDHQGKDCRFLNFKKGDVIFVYHKLSGKRDDLWAGSIDRRFGYFPKDAVKVDEIHAKTEKEVATQKHDFFCIDEYGSLIDHDSSEWDNEENLVSEFQEIATNDAQDSKTSKDAFLSQSFAQSSDETGNKDANQAGMEDFSDNTKPAPSEQGGSQWIGSTVTGWLSLGGENPDDNPKEDNPEQESFRSRKLALDIDGNQLEKETKKTDNSGWFGDGLTSAFGFGQKAPEEEKPIEKEVEEQPPPSNSWLNIGIRDVLHFGQSNQDKVEERVEAAGRDETTGTTDPQDLDSSQSHHDATLEQIKETEHQRDDNTGKEAERTDTHPSKPIDDYNHGQEDRHSQEEDGELRKEEDAGWYGSIYHNIAGLYGEQGGDEEDEDILIAEDREDKDISLQSETESQSVFSSMFDTLASQFQADNPNDYKNAQTDELTDIKPADADTEISLTSQMVIPYDSTEVSVDLVPPEIVTGNEQRQTEILEEADTENMSVEDFIHVHKESHESQKDSDEKHILNDRSGMMDDQKTAIEDNNLPLDDRNQTDDSNEILEAFKQLLQTSKYMSLSHDPQLQDTTRIVNLEVDPEKTIAEIRENDEHDSAGRLKLDDITTNEPVSSHGDVEPNQLVSDPKPDNEEDVQISTVLPDGLLHANDEDALNHHQESPAADLAENSLDDVETVHSVGRDVLEGSGIPNLSDSIPIQTKAETLTEELPDVSEDTSVMHTEVEDNDIVTTGIEVVSSNQKGDDSIQVPQSPAEKDSGDRVGMLNGQTSMPGTEDASVLEEVTQTPDPHLHDAQEPHIAEPILNLSLVEPVIVDPVIENVSGVEGHNLITTSEDGESKDKNENTLEKTQNQRGKKRRNKNPHLIFLTWTSMNQNHSLTETDRTNCINDDCFTRNENEDLTNLKGEQISGEGDIQTPTLTDKYKPEPAVMEYLFSSARQVTGDAVAQMLTVKALLKWLTVQVVSSLPDDIRPGPDLYGLPWEAVIITALLGLGTLLLFSCRFYQCIKSRLYSGKERRMGLKVAELLDEKCKVLEILSEVQQKYEKLETALQNSGILAHAAERENLEVMSQRLKRSNKQLGDDIEKLKKDLNIQRARRLQQEDTIADMQETLKTLEEETRDLKSQTEQAQTTLKIYDMNSERNQNNLEAAKEEKALLQEKHAQLVQEAEGWGERMSELEEEMRMCESSYTGMLQDATNKDERIKSLTDCLLKMKDWDSVLEDKANGEERNGTQGTGNGEGQDNHQRQRIQKLIHAAKMNADLKSVDEDKDRVFAKLTDEVKAKEDLQDSEKYTGQVQKLQQKLQIMTEMYQENELKLHRMLTVEERERLQKDEKLTKADKSITLAVEERNSYRSATAGLPKLNPPPPPPPPRVHVLVFALALNC